MKTLHAVILAGGLGTRLRSVVPDQPKVLAEICGRPFIEHLLDQLVHAGIRSVVLCTGYKGDQVAAALGSSYHGLTLHYSRESSPLGTGGAVRLALPWFTSDTVLILNGDSLCDTPLEPFVQGHRRQNARASMLLTREKDTRRYGRVEVDPVGHIIQFYEKSDVAVPGWINAGVYLLGRDVIELIPLNTTVGLERELFPSLIGHGLYGHCSEGLMWDIGIPEAYELANSGQVPMFARARR